jgi:hypothetical protein
MRQSIEIRKLNTFQETRQLTKAGSSQEQRRSHRFDTAQRKVKDGLPLSEGLQGLTHLQKGCSSALIAT